MDGTKKIVNWSLAVAIIATLIFTPTVSHFLLESFNTPNQFLNGMASFTAVFLFVIYFIVSIIVLKVMQNVLRPKKSASGNDIGRIKTSAFQKRLEEMAKERESRIVKK